VSATTLRRDRLLISACIALASLIAWSYLIHIGHQMSADMQNEKLMSDMGMPMEMKWTVADLFLTFVMWAVMMIGMMTPAASPMLLLFAGAQAKRAQQNTLIPTLTFAFGYVAVWTSFSVFAALGQGGLHRAALLSPSMASSSTRFTGVILLVAGAYQLSPWKGKCLTRCRSPLGFFMNNWREGNYGAFEMGFRHGSYCLGCCWALMCVLFVVGVMNLVWVAALTTFVLIEKIGPAGAIFARLAGAGMLGLGIVEITGIAR
jgi:predicted metal-binding membrane protein